MDGIQWFRAALAVDGLGSIVFGIGLLCWGAVQRSARAGLEEGGPAAIIKAIAGLFDALGRLMPNGASKVGGFLVLAGMVMIGGAYYVSH